MDYSAVAGTVINQKTGLIYTTRNTMDTEKGSSFCLTHRFIKRDKVQYPDSVETKPTQRIKEYLSVGTESCIILLIRPKQD